MDASARNDQLRASDEPLGDLLKSPDGREYRHHSPGEHAVVTGEGLPQVQIIVGGTGFDSSTIAGAVAAAREKVNVIKWWAASGGGITALPALLGFSPHDYRMTNVGAPSGEAIVPLGDEVTGGFVTRKGLDLTGTMTTDALEEWLTEMAKSRGVYTWEDLAYKDGEARPMGEMFKLSVSLVMWSPGVAKTDPRTGKPRIYTDEELRDPNIIKAEDARYMFSTHSPVHSVEQVWFPDDLHSRPDLAFLREEVMNENPGRTIADSSRQLPACIKRMRQNKTTGQLFFFADGAHLETQAMRGNGGHVLQGAVSEARNERMNVPVINLRMAKTTHLPGDRRRHQTGSNLPLADVVNIRREGKKIGLRDGFRLTARDRDKMYLTGLRLARTLLPNVVATMNTRLDDKLIAIQEKNTIKDRDLIQRNYERSLEWAKEHFGEDSEQYAQVVAGGPAGGDLEHTVAEPRWHIFRAVMGAPEPDRNLTHDFGVTT